MRKTEKYKEDPQVFLLAVRDAAEAQGGMSWLADRSNLNRESLYRTLSARGNPRLSSLRAVLGVFGLGRSVTKKPRHRR